MLLSAYTVTSTADDGSAGTLRYAINQANASGSTITEIDFNIGTSGSAQTINLTSALPALNAPNAVFINGLSQGGSGNTTRLITLDGTNAGSGSNGLLLQGSNETASGLIIENFAGNGIEVQGAGNTLGGSVAGAGNILGGNGSDGVRIDSGASGNQVLGNYIGFNASLAADANAANGVNVAGTNNSIGGTAYYDRNLIAGNTGDGVLLSSSATGNQVLGNDIGVNYSGLGALANSIGIEVAGNNNTVGGSASGSYNIISGNTTDGVKIDSGGGSNLVEGNYIGLNIYGSAAVGNSIGIEVAGSNNMLGTSYALSSNVISGNTGDGVLLDSTGAGNQVLGNYIGTDPTGTAAMANKVGIEDAGSSNTIGGSVLGDKNVISGNTGDGVLIDSTATGETMWGNYIGLNSNAITAIANGTNGVEIEGSGNNNGGNAGSNYFFRNFLSGNKGDGLKIDSSASGNQVQGNFIGIAVSGTIGVANSIGIEIAGNSNTLGGTAYGVSNVISGISGDGVLIDSTGAGNVIQNNFVGTDYTGRSPLGNSASGIEIQGTGNTVGGTASGAGNVLSGNSADGLRIDSTASGNLVLGSSIGLNLSGAGSNSGSGVNIAGNNNTVGGSASGAGNTIASNKSGGVLVGAGSGDTISQNSIYTNGIFGTGSGIILTSGANNNIGAPNLTSTTLSGSTLTVKGTFAAPTANVNYMLDFFANPGGDGEGRIYLGSLTVTPTSTGTQNFTFTTTTTVTGTDPLITATLTDPSGDTSQISTPDDDTFTALTSSADQAAPGQRVTFTATVSSTGGTPMGTVTFEDGTTVLGTATLSSGVSGAVASFTPLSLATGFHSIIAVYSGDGPFLGSSSATLSEVVQPVSTTTTLSSSANPVTPGQSTTLTATVSGSNGGTPTGMVTFMDGTAELGTATLSATASGAQAIFSTSPLALGSYVITAVYEGDSTFAGSTSASLSETVQNVSTLTAVSSSSDPVATDQSVTFTATVSGANGGTPTGTITFFEDGNTSLGTAALSATSSGVQAVFTQSSLTAGPHTITAVYSGDGTFAGSSASLVQIVGQSTATSSSTSLVSSTSLAAPGATVTFTATVSGAGGGTPTGTVTFMDGSTVLGTATLTGTSSGVQAIFTTSSLATGMHSLVAEYGGDSTYAASSSASLSQPVQLVNSSTSLTSSVDPDLVGQSVMFTATVLGANGDTPTGTVTFMNGSTVLGTATLSATTAGSQATFATSVFTVGANTITAVYSGDSTFASSTSASTDESVQQIVSYTALSSSNPSAASNQSVTFTATVVGASGGIPTGTITFQDGSTVLATVNLSAATTGAQAIYTTSSLSSGIHDMTAVYNGDSTFLNSTGTLAQSVSQSWTSSTVTSLSSSVNLAAPGQSVTLTAAVYSSGSGTPTGTMAFMDGSTLLGTAILSAATTGAQATFTTANLADGSHSITAVYSGDSTFSGSASSALTQTVQQVNTATSLTTSAALTAPGQSVTFTATVVGGDGGSPTGTITFKDGTTVLGTATLNATTFGAQAVFTTSSLGNGTHSITAAYGGTSYYADSTSAALNETVQQLGSSTTLSSSANPSAASQSVTFTATVVGANGGTPTGTVTFMDGNTT